MEAGDGPAGHGDEHEAPDGGAGGVHVVQVIPQLGDDVVGVGNHAEGHAHGHNDQADAEHGVDLADDLVHRDEGGDEVVDQDENEPEHLVGQDAAGVLAQQLEQAGGAHGKDGAHHDEQHHAEHPHDVLHAAAQVDTGDLRDGRTLVTLREHPGEVVVDAAGEDGAEGDPQEDAGAPQGAGQCAEDGAQAGDIQQLDQEQLPLGHDHVVHPVVDADGGGLPVIRAEGAVNHFAVDKVAGNQQGQTHKKTYHKYTSLKFQSRRVWPAAGPFNKAKGPSTPTPVFPPGSASPQRRPAGPGYGCGPGFSHKWSPQTVC